MQTQLDEVGQATTQKMKNSKQTISQSIILGFAILLISMGVNLDSPLLHPLMLLKITLALAGGVAATVFVMRSKP